MGWIISTFSVYAKSVESLKNNKRRRNVKKIAMLGMIVGLILVSGCATVGPWIEDIEWPFSNAEEETGVTQKDAIPIDIVKWSNPEASLWPITYSARATYEAGIGIYLHQDATMYWKAKQGVCASMWLIGDWGNGDICALPMDYVRPGGGGWNKKHIDYEWVFPNGKKLKDALKIYCMVSGLCRDARRNVKERCPIVLVEK